MSPLPYTTLDVFTTTRFTGNQLAIIPLPTSTHLTQTLKQSIASEFNLSEIVFLHPSSPTSPLSRQIDIFTSHAEVPFAGHPTVGTAWYLLSILGEKVEKLITKAGEIPIELDKETGVVRAEIPFDFHEHGKKVVCGLTPEVKEGHSICSIVKGMSFIYVQLSNLEALTTAASYGNLNPSPTYNPEILDKDWQVGLVGTMYYVPQGVDEFGRKKYRTRMFGSREDPGTGSASSGLACFLAGKEEGGKVAFAFEQGVEMGRRNDISVEVVKGEEGAIEKVVLSGKGVKVMEGSLEV